MKEALTPEEQVVKDYNLKKGIEKKAEVTEKQIDGETWIKKENIKEIEDSEIEVQLRTLIAKVKKGRTDQEAADVIRHIVKKLVYPLESKEPRG